MFLKNDVGWNAAHFMGENENPSSSARITLKQQNCTADDGKEMDRSEKRSCMVRKALFLPSKALALPNYQTKVDPTCDIVGCKC